MNKGFSRQPHYNSSSSNSNYHSDNHGQSTTTTTFINREQVCPFLLRVFIKEGSFHKLDEFSSRKAPEHDEIQIYTWRNTSLKEITVLIKETYKLARNKDSKFDFQFVYPDSRGNYVSRFIGTVCSNKKSNDDQLTLDECNFNYQYLDILLTLPPTTTTTTTNVTTNTTTTTTTTSTSPPQKIDDDDNNDNDDNNNKHDK